MIVKSELQKFGFHFLMVELGEVVIMETLSAEQIELLNNKLNKTGLFIIEGKKSILIEKIKNVIINLVYYSDKQLKLNLSDYLSEELDFDYTYLANIFSESQGTTIEHFYISHKIERVKELLIYDELNLTEIASKVHYSSVGHLSNQFKKLTGLTPTQYKQLKNKIRNPIENV